MLRDSGLAKNTKKMQELIVVIFQKSFSWKSGTKEFDSHTHPCSYTHSPIDLLCNETKQEIEKPVACPQPWI